MSSFRIIEAEFLLESSILMINEDQTGNLLFKGKPCCFAITIDICYLYKIGQVKKQVQILAEFSVKSLLGSSFRRIDKNICNLDIFLCCPVNNWCCGASKQSENRRRKRKHITISFNFKNAPNEEICINWMNTLQSLSSGIVPSTPFNSPDSILGLPSDINSFKVPAPPIRKFLVIVNPVSGRGTAMQVWSSTTKPMLQEAGITYTFIKTTHANHARSLISGMSEEEQSQYSAVLVIGGDGLLFEVVNGFSDRVLLPSSSSILSSNELQSSNNGLSNALPSQLVSQDAIQHLQRIFYSVNIAPIPGGTGNGLVKTILHECGEAYSAMNATFVAIKGQPRPVDLSCVRLSNGARMMSFLSLSTGLVSDIDILSESMRWMGEMRLYVAAVYYMLRKRLYSGKLYLKLSESTSSGWDVVVEGSHIGVWVTQTAYVASTMCVNPAAHLGDGVFTVFVMQPMSRWRLLQLLLEMDTGGHITHPYVKMYVCSQYLFAPEVDMSNGVYSLDGEAVDAGPLEGVMLKGMARFLSLPAQA